MSHIISKEEFDKALEKISLANSDNRAELMTRLLRLSTLPEVDSLVAHLDDEAFQKLQKAVESRNLLSILRGKPR